ncbi:MarR family transcriptional regulator [Dokdonia pacifica]|uniref:DNA-binding transcriptional regulator, MarR family n=1 Tax=Dokdonia pacifica TaxID=1627892 RepID=A0A238ZFF0_9FLAO|nr:MarR family transcriptional regulator [Dokdonia pacifica]GGG06018.1 MarR family transcriptional regulator [Dokdonia pacifica]SNR81869.1 DNA-binding transcriptional regulator, MarR family [Dokdonia pacifica]
MIHNNIYFQIELTARKIRQYGQNVLRSHGIDITIEQWLVLNVINDNETTNQIFIGEKLVKDKPTISRMVNQLDKKGFIIKTSSSSDSRQVSLSISKKGKTLIHNLQPIIEGIRLKGLQELSEKESQHIKSILNKIQKNLDT